MFRRMSDEEFQKMVDEHDQHATMFTKEREQAQQQYCWDAGIKIIKACGHMDLPEYHIQFELAADRKIKILQASYPRLEWLAYLVGKVDHTTRLVTVEDLVIPKQMVTAASVYNVEYAWNEGLPIIGVIHSHHTMGAFFSGTDDTYINQNHDVSIVVATAAGREIKAQVRVKAPCGSYYINEKIKFSVNYPNAFDEAEFRTEFGAKIGQFTYTYPAYTGGAYADRNGGGRVVHGGNFRRPYNTTGTPLFPSGQVGNRLSQTLRPGDYDRLVGGGVSRNTTNHLIPSSDSLLANSGYCTEDGWDTKEEWEVPSETSNPHLMTEDQLRKELSYYYNPDDVEDFIETDEAAEELEEIYKMIKAGVYVEPLVQVIEDEEESSTIDPKEVDELEAYQVYDFH